MCHSLCIPTGGECIFSQCGNFLALDRIDGPEAGSLHYSQFKKFLWTSHTWISDQIAYTLKKCPCSGKMWANFFMAEFGFTYICVTGAIPFPFPKAIFSTSWRSENTFCLTCEYNIYPYWQYIYCLMKTH